MTRFIALVSGKGGVGKTTSTLNLGYALTEMDKKVLLLDANLVTPNLALQLGIVNPKHSLNQFLRKEKSLQDITYLHESGLSLIPASPSLSEYQKTNPQKLAEVFEHLDGLADVVLIDAPSGLGYEVNHVLKNSDEILVVVNPNLSSVMDAMKTVQLAKSNNNIVAGIILNMSNKGKNELSPEEIESLLGSPIIGNIRHDKKMRKALHKQYPVNHLYPRSKLAKEFKKVADFISLQK